MLALVLQESPLLHKGWPKPHRKPGEALIKMRCAGVCDTDLQLARGYMNYRGVLGHEFVGEVVEAESPHWRGKRVVADINAGCGECPDCTQRDGHHCKNRTVLGIAGRDGAFAEFLVMPERTLVEVPDSVQDDAAVFAEPLAAALHVVDASTGLSEAIVLGDGKLGLLTAMALHAHGIQTLLVGHHRDKLAIAAGIGIATCLESDLDESQNASLVVEATGSSKGLTRALALCEPRGTVVLKTTVADFHEVDLSPVVISELQLVGSRCGSLPKAIECLRDARVDPTPLICARYTLERSSEALRHAGQTGALKVLIEA
jgi:threonine dehydrogenase-like Zn-dependent dehydrogenase